MIVSPIRYLDQASKQRAAMANERRNERMKLLASWCNTISGGVIALGTAAPVIVGVYNWFKVLDPAKPMVSDWQIPAFWLTIGVAIHGFGHAFLEGIVEKEATDDE
jgi:hypothetical protein